jgi:hypothetical protein
MFRPSNVITQVFVINPSRYYLPSQQLSEWHALPPVWRGLSYDEFVKERRVRMARVIRKACQLRCGELIAQPAPSISVADMLAAGESANVEFGSTSRTDLHLAQSDEKMRLAA